MFAIYPYFIYCSLQINVFFVNNICHLRFNRFNQNNIKAFCKNRHGEDLQMALDFGHGYLLKHSDNILSHSHNFCAHDP